MEELSGQIEVESTGRNTESPNASSGHDNAQRTMSGGLEGAGSEVKDGEPGSDFARRKDIHQQFGRMVLSDQKGTTRYVSSGFWSKMNDEVCASNEHCTGNDSLTQLPL